MNRRQFLASAGAVTAAGFAPGLVRAASAAGLHIATNTYPWGTFAKRAGRDFVLGTDAALAAIASTGIAGYEPLANLYVSILQRTGPEQERFASSTGTLRGLAAG